jgi:nitroimidazol reductase NimA-like FMN-containing flavoprotein (pyridoxamine 5'-phosphate oxidase superfamily)
MTDKQPPEWMGKNGKLTPAEIKEFLAGPVVARIATIDEDGVPYVTPVWQEWDGEVFWIVPRERSAWVAHIKKNPNVGISCAQDSGTYKRIMAQGKAEIVFGPAPMQGQCLDVANRMALRFLGEHGPEYLVPTYDRPRYLIKAVPTKMITWDGIEWAKKYTEK